MTSIEQKTEETARLFAETNKPTEFMTEKQFYEFHAFQAGAKWAMEYAQKILSEELVPEVADHVLSRLTHRS